MQVSVWAPLSSKSYEGFVEIDLDDEDTCYYCDEGRVFGQLCPNKPDCFEHQQCACGKLNYNMDEPWEEIDGDTYCPECAATLKEDE